jgi:hypothetical protein
MPFEDEDLEEEFEGNKLKNISSKKSIFDSKTKKPNKADFNKKIDAIEVNRNSYTARLLDFNKRYFGFLNDKTLKQNKNILVREMERTSLSEMLKLAEEINLDEREAENQGSLGLISTLLQANLIQRNQINNLDFEVDSLKKEISLIKSKLFESIKKD